MCLLVGPFQKLNELSKDRRMAKVGRVVKVIEFKDFSFGSHEELSYFLFFDLSVTVLDDVEEGGGLGEGLFCSKLFQHFLLSNNNYSLLLNKSQHL